jgi:phage shock protein C
MNDRLYRSRDDRVIAGVAGGLAERLNADPSLVRVIWALLILPTGFIALLVYIVMAMVVPEEDDLYGFMPPPSTFSPPPPTDASGTVSGGAVPPGTPAGGTWPVSRDQWRAQQRAERAAHRTRHGPGSGGVILGTILILVGVWYLLREYVPAFEPDRFWPFALVGLGVVLLVIALGRRSGAPRDDVK